MGRRVLISLMLCAAVAVAFASSAIGETYLGLPSSHFTADDGTRVIEHDRKAHVGAPRQLTPGQRILVRVKGAVPRVPLLVQVIPKNCPAEDCVNPDDARLTDPGTVRTSGKARARFVLTVPSTYVADNLDSETDNAEKTVAFKDGQQVQLIVFAIGGKVLKRRNLVVFHVAIGQRKAFINVSAADTP